MLELDTTGKKEGSLTIRDEKNILYVQLVFRAILQITVQMLIAITACEFLFTPIRK